ncbi:peptidoglycan-binding protein [Streptomyces sp. NRRL S-87]|uniref:peptidoglycan-binding protein n=1 Tax=Streptomyces sp. NRRL S-87 TaxID=1463920 RepID=UPI0004BEE77B|nr:peptidoglycan-binding protein [Streptomyces sp. NRRL S-87]
MPDLWMPGATRLDIGDHAPTDGGPAKAVAHVTWDRNASAAEPADLVPYETLVTYFGRNPDGKAAAPHLLWDPFTGRLTQFHPADSRSKSLVDRAGGTRTNRAGSVVIQVEALFFPYCRVDGRVYARLRDAPCKGWAALRDWVHAWGVPNVWPMGQPTDFTAHRDESVWERQGGWYAHAHVPENDHTDPGSWPDLADAPAPGRPAYEPFPGSGFFVPGRRSPVIAAMHARLVAVGCGRYRTHTDVDVWGSGDRASYAAWQRKLGYSGDDADGIPGRTSWNKLQVPRV